MTSEGTWQEWNDFIRLQKHWMLNQFQIVMGYIQIGKAELAFDYIKKASNMVHDTTAFTKMQDTEFGVRACLIWWNMCEGGIILNTIVDEHLTVPNKEIFFADFRLFMEDLKERYLAYFGDEKVTWQLVFKKNTLVSTLRCNDELPNLYEKEMPFRGKITVEGSTITYSFNF